MKTPVALSGDINKIIQQVLNALNNNLNAIDNFQAKIMTVVAPGVANTQFTLQHNLGRVPAYYIWNIDQAGIVYDSLRSTWTSTQMFLKCSVASANLVVIVCA